MNRDSLYRMLGIRRGEEPAVLLFIGYSLSLGIAVAVFYTASTSLFLTNFNARQLPLAFIAGGVLVYGLGWLVRRVQRRVSFVRLNAFLLLFLVVSVGVMVFWPAPWYTRWLYSVLFLWNRVYVFVNGFTFWATAAQVFNFSQSKRLFSFISLGDVVSSILSYFSVPLLLKLMNTEQLLVISLLFSVLCGGLMRVINRRFHRELSAATGDGKASAPPPDGPTHPRYTRLLYALSLLSVAGLVYVDYLFSVQIKAAYPNRNALASFLGIFLGICAVIELLIKLFVYNQLVRAYSVRVVIALLPVSLLFSFGLAAAYGTAYGASPLFFAFIALSRFFMSSVRKSINEPAFQVLFQPISPAERSLIQSRIEGGPKAWGNVLPGVLLLGLNALFGVTPVQLSVLFLAVLVVWVAVCLRLPAEYRAVLSDTFRRAAPTVSLPEREIADPHPSEPLPFERATVLAQSARAADRVLAAHGLGESGRYAAVKSLNALLTDADPAVREAALRAAGQAGRSELWPRVLAHLASGPHRPTVEAVVRRAGEAAMPALEDFFENGPTSERARVVQLVADIGGEPARRFLRARFAHADAAVREAVYAGLARLGHRTTLSERPTLIEQLDEHLALLCWLMATRADVRPAGLPDLEQALRTEEQRTVGKTTALLALLCGDERLVGLNTSLTPEDAETNGFLLEWLATLLPADQKAKVLAVVADWLLPESVRRSAAHFPQEALPVEDRLNDLINQDFSKIAGATKAAALRGLARVGTRRSSEVLVASLVGPDDDMARAAAEVLAQLDPERWAELQTRPRVPAVFSPSFW